jgi:hypothetical protein
MTRLQRTKREGFVTPAVARANLGRMEVGHGCPRRLRGHDSRDLAPRLKSALHGGAVLGRREEVVARTEQIAEATEQRDKPLRRVRRLETLHLPLSQPGRKMRLLDAIVEPRGRSHPQVLDAIQLRHALHGRPVAGQPIGDDLLR